MSEKEELRDIEWIMSVIPHRYPLLLVDRVLEIEPKKSIVAIKNVTANEEFFSGHFPGHPVMPGVLVIEAMAQRVPPIVTHVGGMPELVVDRRSGLVVPPRDPDALAAAIRELAHAPEWRAQLGDAARRRIVEAFDVEETVRRTLDLYLELTGELR